MYVVNATISQHCSLLLPLPPSPAHSPLPPVSLPLPLIQPPFFCPCLFMVWPSHDRATLLRPRSSPRTYTLFLSLRGKAKPLPWPPRPWIPSPSLHCGLAPPPLVLLQHLLAVPQISQGAPTPGLLHSLFPLTQMLSPTFQHNTDLSLPRSLVKYHLFA